jgi:ssDNA-binding Zn-finger/Zn-ribbon topoisomerase 1
MSLDPIIVHDAEHNRISVRCPHDNTSLLRLRGATGPFWVCPKPPHGPGCGYVVNANVVRRVKRKHIAAASKAFQQSIEDLAACPTCQEAFRAATRRAVEIIDRDLQR